MPRGNTEVIEVIRAGALTNSAITRFRAEFPLGEGWTRLSLRINLALTIGSGSGAISEGELQIIQGINFKAGKDLVANNVPGRLLYRLNSLMQGAPAVRTAFAAATATYRVPLDIWFSDPLMQNADDTILDTQRYSSVELAIQMGGLANLLTTVGTASLISTVDVSVERVKGILEGENRPVIFPVYDVVAPQIPSTQTFIDMERSEDLAYKRLMVMSTTGSTSGVPFSGTADDTVISDLDIQADGAQNPFNLMLADVLQRQAQMDYGLEAIPAGLHFLDFCKDGSSMRALYSGDKSRLRLNWRNQASLPATPQVTLGYQGFRYIPQG